MDYDRDGHLDILSGCYWSSLDDGGNPQAGYTMMLKGQGTLSFHQAEPICDRNSQPLTNIKLSKSQIENYDRKNLDKHNICTRQHLVDYDGDGDLDLVNGCSKKAIFLHVNQALSSASLPVFEGEARKLKIESPDSHNDPHLVDFDSDGDLDLLTGGVLGGVYISINNGTRVDPKWAPFVTLVNAIDRYEILGETNGNATPYRASRVWVYDFNHDGKLDLLVGDSTEIVGPLPKCSPEEFAKTRTDYVEKVESLLAKQDDAKRRDDKEELERINGEFAKVEPLREQLFNIRQTGHVWLYLQR